MLLLSNAMTPVRIASHVTYQTKGRVMESAGTRAEETVQARTVGITDLEAERVVADKAQTYWPRLEGLAPWFLRT
jgi:hypothetical protein